VITCDFHILLIFYASTEEKPGTSRTFGKIPGLFEEDFSRPWKKYLQIPELFNDLRTAGNPVPDTTNS